VFSDNGPTHTESKGKPLGVEVHALAYAYKRGGAADNIVFYDYQVVNKSANSYHSFRFGQFDDVDLGYAFDDYIGYDSLRRLGICYNGSPDDGASGGHPAGSYGTRIPVMGLEMLVMPGAEPAGEGCSFIYYNNDPSVLGNPTYDTQYNHYLRAELRDGSHFTDDFAGRGVHTVAHGMGPNTNYVYNGDPGDTTTWSECNSNNPPGDRRFVISSYDFALAAGATQHLVMALMATKPDTLNACPGVKFDSIKALADSAWNLYIHPRPPLPPTIVTTAAMPELHIYPNPAHDALVVESSSLAADAVVKVYDVMGRQQQLPTVRQNDKITISTASLTTGIYLLQYRCGAALQTVKFLKE
jgi:hypothetical protein